MNENNNEQEQPLYKEQPWWVQIFVALYAMFWLTMIFAAGLNSLYIGCCFDSWYLSFDKNVGKTVRCITQKHFCAA